MALVFKCRSGSGFRHPKGNAKMAPRPVTQLPFWHLRRPLAPGRGFGYHGDMARKQKKKPLRRRVRKRMPPPSKVVESESEYDRERDKRRVEREAEQERRT